MKLKKLGTVTKIDMSTGEVIATERNAMTLLPAPPGTCAECAVDHPWDQPHNKDSIHYQFHFYSMHGRWPTWTDAMAHCAPEMRQAWREQLLAVLSSKGLEVPEDLMVQMQVGR